MKNEYFGIASTILIHEVANGDVIRFLVTSNSMHPFIRKNDYLSVESLPSKNYSIGEIVVIRQGEGFLTHRLVTRRGEMVITKGDACILPDEPISIEAIIGRALSTDCEDYQFHFTSIRGRVANAIIGFLGLINISFFQWIGRVARQTIPAHANRLISVSMRVLSYPMRLKVLFIYLCVSSRR